MDNIRAKIAPSPQKKYRKAQANKGLVRYEIQITEESRDRFEEMVRAVAAEYVEPFSEKRRAAKARIQIFEELTQDIVHEFFALKDQITALREQVNALAPSFFKASVNASTPLPDVIKSLPDDPAKLKQILFKVYSDLQKTKLSAAEYKRQSEQFLQLYELADKRVDELSLQLQATGIDDPPEF